MKKIFYIAVVLLLLLGCNSEHKVEKSKKLQVFTTIYPYYDFATKIGKEKVDVYSIFPAGADPHGFEPSAKTIAKVMNCDVFIYNGLDLEPWLNNLLTNMGDKVPLLVNASDLVEKIKKGDQFDPHIWLDLVNDLKIANGIKDALVNKDNLNKSFYEENFAKLKQKIENLNSQFQDKIANLKSKKLVTSHAAFAYFAKRYGLEQVPVAGIDSHEEPSAAHMVNLVKFIKENKIRTIYVEPMTSKKLTSVIAKEANVETLTLNPLGTLTLEEQKSGKDFFSVMEENFNSIVIGLNK